MTSENIAKHERKLRILWWSEGCLFKSCWGHQFGGMDSNYQTHMFYIYIYIYIYICTLCTVTAARCVLATICPMSHSELFSVIEGTQIMLLRL